MRVYRPVKTSSLDIAASRGRSRGKRTVMLRRARENNPPALDQDVSSERAGSFTARDSGQRYPKAHPLLAYMPFVVRPVQLNQETIGIPEFERFLRPTCLQLQVARLEFRDNFIGFEIGDSQVEVIHCGRIGLLLDAEEALADSKDVCLIRMLLERHPENILVEF